MGDALVRVDDAAGPRAARAPESAGVAQEVTLGVETSITSPEFGLCSGFRYNQ